MEPQLQPHEPRFDHAGYLRDIEPDVLRDTIEKTVLALTGIQFDALAFRGASGLLVGPSVALRLNKTMILVRKPEEKTLGECHSWNNCEGDRGARRYIIVDDFVCEGNTARKIVEAIKEWAPEAVCLGVCQTYYIRWLNTYDHSTGVDPESTALRTSF